VELTDLTRLDNADSFGGSDLVAATAITQGIATIMSARSILVLAAGEGLRSTRLVSSVFQNPSLAAAAGGPSAFVRARTPVLAGVWTDQIRTDTSWQRDV